MLEICFFNSFQWSFRTIGTMGTRASQAEIDVCVQAPGLSLRVSGGISGGAENARVENAGVITYGKPSEDHTLYTQYLTKSTLFSAKTSRRTYIKTGNINALFNALYCCNNTRKVSRSVNIAHERWIVICLHIKAVYTNSARLWTLLVNTERAHEIVVTDDVSNSRCTSPN